MASPQLSNYLLSNRRRLALTQRDVAYLLGAESDEKVSRHERFHREPTLADALAYEAVYKRSVSELFSGQYQKIEAEVAARANALLSKTDGQKLNQRAVHKRQMIAEIAGIKN
jgi:hypothetical protein